MKKLLLMLTTVMLSFTLLIGNALANSDTNVEIGGEASSGTTDGGGNATGKPTRWLYFQGLRISIVDSNGNRVPGTVSVDYQAENSSINSQNVNTCYYNPNKSMRKEALALTTQTIFTNNTSVSTFKNTPVLKELKKWMTNEDLLKDDPEYLKKYFVNGYGQTNFYNYVVVATGLDRVLGINGYDDILNLPCNTMEQYFFTIEPLMIRVKDRTGYYGTATELMIYARDRNDGSSLYYKNILPYGAYVPRSVPHFTGYLPVRQAYSSSARYEYNDTLNSNYGYGIGVFSLTLSLTCQNQICYKETTTCSTTGCNDTNINNVRSCSSSVEVDNSNNLSDCDMSIKASGKKTYTLQEGVCSLYCTETGSASYPGNVAPAIQAGTNLVWPTANGTGRYPLTTKSTLTCKIEMEDGSSTISQTCRNLAQNANYNYINGSSTAKLTYNDTKAEQEVSLQSSCQVSIDKLDVYGNDIRISNSCRYSLPTNKNIAVNKETLQFVDTLNTSAVTNYILITEYNGVLPIEGIHWSDQSTVSGLLFGKNYKLEITDLPLGYSGRFTNQLNQTAYVCNYQVTTDISGACACPPGTLYSGYDVEGNLVNSQVTCAEAKEKFCNAPYCNKVDGSGIAYLTDCLTSGHSVEYCREINGCKKDDDDGIVCPADTEYAGYQYTLDPRYTACLSGGSDASTCMNMICNCGSNCSYSCPANTLHAGKDISSCIYEQRGAGKNLVDAKRICEQKECNGGETIIYRTISLENPFPGKRANSGSSVFNDDVKGRTPGSNWNGATLVENVILNNRGYDGSKIYEEATPLYTINLDATAIKQIREYNKKQNREDEGYADFELSCTSGAYCISSFLHNGQFTTADGKSILDQYNSTCASARDKNSFISCYRRARTP